MDNDRFPILANLKDPFDIQGFDINNLEALAEESRSYLIESINKTGGHLGAALGVVELTVALFNQFDFLKDRIVWDVGHQAHVHKLLTGRAEKFPNYGKWGGGISKFIERSESPYDHVGAGHASTSISMGAGLAIARDMAGEDQHVISVIGDGAMTGGLAYEALSMAGGRGLNMIVILNDNGMSIDKNVGAFARTLVRITSSGSYNAFRDDVKWITSRVPFGKIFLKGFKHVERSVKDYFSPDAAAFFESLDFRYFGPVPGHDLHELITLLQHVKKMSGPVLIHIHTVKGKGLGPDLENTFESHAVSPPRKHDSGKSASKTWTNIYSEGLTQLMQQDNQVVAITAAMLSNTGLAPLKKRYPGRVLDVGIAEANAFCSAAGLAIGGLKPFVTVYSTFTQRAFDQIIHDIALQNLPVKIMMDRAGLVGSDGPTHHGVFDYSYLRLVPGLVHMAPANEVEMRRMLLTALNYDEGPIAMRFPRGETKAMELPGKLEPLPVGKGELIRQTTPAGILMIAVGSMVSPALEAAQKLEKEGIGCSVINARFIKPLDEDLMIKEITRAKCVLTLEENVLAGGFGEAVLHLIAKKGLSRPIKLLGIPDRFIEYGSQQEQLENVGLTPPQIQDEARKLWEEISTPATRSRKRPA